MRISPSIASADVLRVAEELDYIDRYFDSVHIDIEDGVAVGGISFGIKMTKGILDHSKSREKTIHLEVYDPLFYLDQLKQLDFDVCFIQVCHLKDPVSVISRFKEAGIETGINLCNTDTDKEITKKLLPMSDYYLINTTAHDDYEQLYIPEMEEYALKLAADPNKKVWIDGNVDYDAYLRLKDSNIYCAVMGRGVFNDKKLAVERYCN